MENIFIGNEANKEITDLLEQVIIESKDYEEVEAMYLKEYRFKKDNIPMVELVMVVKDFDFPLKDIQNKYKELLSDILKKYGIQVIISAVPKFFLEYFPDLDFQNMEFIEIVIHYRECLDFMNSRVILDKFGKYEELQQRMISSYTGEECTNKVGFVPPLELKRLK